MLLILTGSGSGQVDRVSEAGGTKFQGGGSDGNRSISQGKSTVTPEDLGDPSPSLKINDACTTRSSAKSYVESIVLPACRAQFPHKTLANSLSNNIKTVTNKVSLYST